jgi:hypothetical protein
MTLDYLLEDAEGLIPPIETVPFDAVEKPRLTDREEIFAAANTAKLLQDLGDDIDVEPEDEVRAQQIFEEGRTPSRYERTLPGVMLKLEALLTEYDYSIIHDAQQVRTYVTNRLLEETSDPDPKIRLRAYELLGKISDVGLFTERKEITVKHQSTEELTDLLRSKLNRLIEGEAREVEDAEDALFEEHSMYKAKKLAETITADDLLKDL